MTNSFSEFARAKMFLVVGSNMIEAHPVAATFLKNAVQKGARLIVVDPRRHRLADFADLHVPLKVGSDIALLNGIMHVLIEEALYDKKFVASCCTGFDELKNKILEYPPERAAEICGIAADTIREAARLLASVKPVMVCYTLGITEHTCGKNNVMSIANLQMLLGNMGVECGGVNPLRGQNNVQGACDMGALPNVFPGYQSVADAALRKKFEQAWGTELPEKTGLMIPQMLEGLADRRIRAFYIFGENLANTEPDIRKVEKELGSGEFIVCQDIFPNETTRFAHVILPAAAWSENDGTFTNSERRVSRVRTASAAPGSAKPNWWIFKQIAKRFGHDWPSSSAEEIWDGEISVLAPSMAGIKYARLEKDGLQWPCPTEDHPGTCYLHRDGQFTCGLGRFNPVDWTPPAEVPDAEYPLVLSTGRRLYHYHTRTQTGRCEGLNDLLGEETADISVADAGSLKIRDREMIRVRSRRGEVQVRARVTDEVPRGMVWMTFHFREGNANWLTHPAFDPDTLTAEYKACAVKIEKIAGQA
jgi:formate dehydrogenase major subunit